MSDNVVQLPRPKDARTAPARLGLYLRVGRNQHGDLLEVLSAGERDFHGIVVDATYAADRHAEIISYALQAQLDVVLDPKTHAMALPGSYSASMSKVPWGLDRHHNVNDFAGNKGRDIATQIAAFAHKYRFTQVLGPTHIINGANDPWLRRDVDAMSHLRTALQSGQSSIELIYPLAVSIKTLRDPLERSALIAALADAPMDAIWLRIENFGSDATGEKTVSYIQAAREFHALGVPVIGDHVGGLSGLGVLAAGAVGGIAHGITLLEGFKASEWRRPRKQGGGLPPTRVYIPKLDILLKPDEAAAFLRSSTRARGRYGCGDTHCCPRGIPDMLNNPTRHFVHQRSAEVARISEAPESIRVSEYLERCVRPISDDVSAASGLSAISNELKKKLAKKQKALGLYRQTFAHFAELDKNTTVSRAPQLRSARYRSE